MLRLVVGGRCFMLPCLQASVTLATFVLTDRACGHVSRETFSSPVLRRPGWMLSTVWSCVAIPAVWSVGRAHPGGGGSVRRGEFLSLNFCSPIIAGRRTDASGVICEGETGEKSCVFTGLRACRDRTHTRQRIPSLTYLPTNSPHPPSHTSPFNPPPLDIDWSA